MINFFKKLFSRKERCRTCWISNRPILMCCKHPDIVDYKSLCFMTCKNCGKAISAQTTDERIALWNGSILFEIQKKVHK